MEEIPDDTFDRWVDHTAWLYTMGRLSDFETCVKSYINTKRSAFCDPSKEDNYVEQMTHFFTILKSKTSDTITDNDTVRSIYNAIVDELNAKIALLQITTVKDWSVQVTLKCQRVSCEGCPEFKAFAESHTVTKYKLYNEADIAHIVKALNVRFLETFVENSYKFNKKNHEKISKNIARIARKIQSAKIEENNTKSHRFQEKEFCRGKIPTNFMIFKNPNQILKKIAKRGTLGNRKIEQNKRNIHAEYNAGVGRFARNRDRG